MNENSKPNNSGELDFYDLIQAIWNEKIKFILILIISVLIGAIYAYNLPNSYQISLEISASEKSEFMKYNSILNIINEKSHKPIYKEVDEITILSRFIRKLKKESNGIIYDLKNNKSIKEKISKLSEVNQNQLLYGYVSSLDIQPKKNNSDVYILTFNWSNLKDGTDIIENILKIALNNFSNAMIAEIIEYSQKIEKLILYNDNKQINFLTEQSLIAKKLDISEPQKVYLENHAYYLRGYRAIDMEIENISNRKYNLVKFVEKEINLIKENPIKWVNYNTLLVGTNSQKNSKIILMISFILGLFVATIYVFIINVLKLRKI